MTVRRKDLPRPTPVIRTDTAKPARESAGSAQAIEGAPNAGSAPALQAPLADTPVAVGAQLHTARAARHPAMVRTWARSTAARLHALAPTPAGVRAAVASVSSWLDNAPLRRAAVAAFATAATAVAAAGTADTPTANATSPTVSSSAFGSGYLEGSYSAERFYQQAMLERLAELTRTRVSATIDGTPDLAAQRTELTKQGEWVPRLTNLLSSQKVLPPALLADVGQLLDELARTKVGSLDVNKAFAFPPLRTKPIGGSLLQELLSASAADLPDRLARTLADYTKLSQSAQGALLVMPDFTTTSPIALQYASSYGTLYIPAGSRIVHKGGQFLVEGAGITWKQNNGWQIVAGRGSFSLGSAVEGFTADLFEVKGPEGSARLVGGTFGFGTDAAGKRTGLIQAESVEIDVKQGTGRLTNAVVLIANNGDASVSARRIDLQDATGQMVGLDGALVSQTRDGLFVRADAASVMSTAATFKAAQLDFKTGPTGMVFKAKSLDVVAKGSSLSVADAVLTAFPGENGTQRFTITGSALAYGHGATAVSAQGNAVAELVLNASGQLTDLKIRGDAVRVGSRGGTLNVVGGGVLIGVDELGAPRRLGLDGAQVTYTGKNLTFSGTNLVVDFDKDSPTRLVGNVTHLDVARGSGKLGFDGGTINATVLPDGSEAVKVSASRITYAGTAESGPLQAVFQTSTAAISTAANGAQTIDVTSRDGVLTLGGRTVSLAGGQQFTLATAADHTLTSFSGVIDNAAVTSKGGALQLNTHAVTTRFADGKLNFDIARADGVDTGRGLKADASGIGGFLEEGRVGLRIANVNVGQLTGTDAARVSDVTLQLAAGTAADGAQVQLADVGIGGVAAHVKGIDFTLTTGNQDVKLGVVSTPAGLMREVSLLIPDGSAVKLQRDDLKLDVGPQALRVARGADGAFHISDVGIDVKARKGASLISVKGGDAEVTLDPRRGVVLLDKITGTDIHAETPKGSVDLKIADLHGFIATMTKLSGPVTGLQMELAPTSDASRMTAALRAEVGGIAVRVDVNDAHALRGLVQVKPNDVNVYFGDPSGRGEVHIQAGPLDCRGAACAASMHYEPFSMLSMMNSIAQLGSDRGVQMLPGVELDPTGKIKLGLSGKGVNASVILLSPDGYGASGAAAPGSGKMKAGGLVVDLGYHTERGTSFGLFGGVVPAATAQLTFQSGTTKLAGIELNDLSIPATGIAGLRYSARVNGGGRFGGTFGAFVNPAAMAPTSIINEPVKGGVFFGLEHSTSNYSLAGRAVVTNTREVGVMVTLAIALGR